MRRDFRATGFIKILRPAALAILLAGCGGGSYGGGGGEVLTVPAAPTGLTTTAGNAQISLTWNASPSATSYYVKRATASGGPYTQVATATSASYIDTGLTNGTPYFYVVSAYNSAGESGNSGESKATPNAPPAAPTGVTATAGAGQVNLTWNAVAGATSYHVKRAIASGGLYTQAGAPSSTNFTDTGLTNGTTYYYVIAAVNAAGEGPISAEVNAKPAAASAVQVSVDTLSNRHAISPYVYGVSYPKGANSITDSGTTMVRWGGNATSRYNWKKQVYNSAADYFFEDYPLTEIGDSDSAKFVKDVIAAGSNPLMTIVMLDWVAKDAERTSHSFSVAKYGAQCKVDQYNSDTGNGQKIDCKTNLTGNDPKDANVPIKDTPSSGDPAGTVYRSEWATALATAFGSAPHFYDMDNEIDIWAGTHRDVHPTQVSYQEMRDVYLAEARALKTWDPLAIRFGPVSCCWYFYWNSDAGMPDKSAHGSVDFLPWWLNEVYWSDLVAGSRSLDVFDIHAYTESNLANLTQGQKQALALRVLRDWWDPTYTSESWFGNTPVLSTDPLAKIAFRLPRMRAIANTNYPGTPVGATEWNVAFGGENDFSTALADAEAYGLLGRERLYAAARWTAPDTIPNSVGTPPAYQALKLYRNYDGQHHGFGTLSVSATHSADPNLFSTFAALDATGQKLTLMIINKDPANAAQVQFALNGFAPNQFTAYTISQASPNAIVASAQQAWVGTQTFAPYTATLLVISGMATTTAAEWDLNPESIMAPANGTVTLRPKLISASGTVTLSSPQFDSGISSMTVIGASVTSVLNGTVTVAAGNNPGFFHFTMTGTDGSGTAQKQGGWIVVGNPAAALTKVGDNQTGPHGTTLTISVTLSPGQSGGTAPGNSILFSTDAGALTQRVATTDSAGKASVTLTLPAIPGTVHVTAEAPYGLGHPVATFTETAQ